MIIASAFSVQISAHIEFQQSEVQALRIFGIFILGRIDHGLWKSVSRFLTSRGREYHER